MSDLKVWDIAEVQDKPRESLYVAAERGGDTLSVPTHGALLMVRSKSRRRRAIKMLLANGDEVTLKVKPRADYTLGPFMGPEVRLTYPRPGSLSVFALACPDPMA